jgi:hypothetical protein
MHVRLSELVWAIAEARIFAARLLSQRGYQHLMIHYRCIIWYLDKPVERRESAELTSSR